MGRTLKLGEIVLRKADGAKLKLAYYGDQVGSFRATDLLSGEVVDLHINEINFGTASNRNGNTRAVL